MNILKEMINQVIGAEKNSQDADSIFDDVIQQWISPYRFRAKHKGEKTDKLGTFKGAEKVPFTPISLIRKMVKGAKLSNKDVHIGVLFTIEAAFYLKYKEYSNITLISLEFDDKLEKFAEHYGFKYKTIAQLEKEHMKFDVIIGNPPYSEDSGARNVKLWIDFIKKALSLKPTDIFFVTPDAIISDRCSNGKYIRNKILESNYEFVSVNRHPRELFNVGVDTCDWRISNSGQYNSIDPVIIKTKDLMDDITSSILDKVANNSRPKLKLEMQNGHVASADKTPSGNLILYSGNKVSYTDKKLVSDKKLKLVFPFSSSYHKQFITREDLGMLNLFIYIKDEAEGNQIMSYTLSKLYIFFAKRYRKTSGFCAAVKSGNIPKLDPSIIWTDDLIYKEFNLTQDEILFIENNI